MRLPLLACVLWTSTTHPGAAARDGWLPSIVFQAEDKLGACAVGDLDPERAGDEIVSVCRSGEVFLTARDGTRWETRRIGRTPGEMIQLAIGDVLPDVPGPEIVAVGAADGTEVDAEPGMAWVLARDGRSWSAQAIHQSPQLLHAVAVRDGEVVVAGYALEVTAVRREGPRWTRRSLGRLPGAGKCALTVGADVVIACLDGSLVRLSGAGALEVLDRRTAGRARLGAYGARILVCDDDGTLSLLEGLAGPASPVYRERDKLRGAVIADLDPARPGPELATAGYERRLTILTAGAEGWEATPVLLEADRFHGLASGDLDGDGDHELVACGYAGRLIVVDRHVAR